MVVIGKVEGQYSHVYSVDTDNYGDSIALTDALIESGHKNIACLCMRRLMFMFQWIG